MSPQPTAAWYDAQYNARASIPDQAAIRQSWMQRSAQARATLPCSLDLAYGPHHSERLDIFGNGQPLVRRRAPVLVYIHGGYWRALDKNDQSFVAAPFVAAGARVVLPNYALAPQVSLRHIVLQMVQAVAWVYRNIGAYGGDPQHIVVAGHSAGGHLATMLLACAWPQVAAELPSQILRAALSVSGIYDLEPLRHAPFLAGDLKLSAAEAQALSPAGLRAPSQGQLVAVVGADESAEFQRQNALIRQAWGLQTVPVCEALPARHHMSVLHDLAAPGQRLHGLALGLLGLA
jgi:arylformamidase